VVPAGVTLVVTLPRVIQEVPYLPFSGLVSLSTLMPTVAPLVVEGPGLRAGSAGHANPGPVTYSFQERRTIAELRYDVVVVFSFLKMNRIRVKSAGAAARIQTDLTPSAGCAKAEEKLAVVIRPPLWPFLTILTVAVAGWLLWPVIKAPLSPMRTLIVVPALTAFVGLLASLLIATEGVELGRRDLLIRVTLFGIGTVRRFSLRRISNPRYDPKPWAAGRGPVLSIAFDYVGDLGGPYRFGRYLGEEDSQVLIKLLQDFKARAESPTV
jgi:hypothetical protein